jgi:hypothetical protein
MSFLPKEMPAFAAWRKPRPISRSAKITLSFWPQWRYTASITSEMFFFVSSRFTRPKGSCDRAAAARPIIIRPGVVTTRSVTVAVGSSIVLRRARILLCSVIVPAASACSISPIEAKAGVSFSSVARNSGVSS